MNDGKFRSVDSLAAMFGGNSSPAQEQSARTLVDIDIGLIAPHPKQHTFHTYSDDELQALANSIKENGLLSNAIVRPFDDGQFKYQMVAGHSRMAATLLNGDSKLLCEIRDMDDEQADIVFIDTNFQQRDVSIVEKCKGFFVKYNAMKRQGKRNDLTDDDEDAGKKALEILADEEQKSDTTIYRYVRCGYMPDALLFFLQQRFSIEVGTELSHLSHDSADVLATYLQEHDKVKISMAAAKALRSHPDTLTPDEIAALLVKDDGPKAHTALKIPMKRIKAALPQDSELLMMDEKGQIEYVVAAVIAYAEKEVLNE